MSLFQRLTRTIRPASFNAASTFRTAKYARTPRMDPNFFGSSGQRIGLRSFRSSPNTNMPKNMRIIYGVMGINVSIWFYAQYAREQARQGHPQNLILFQKNMMCSLYNTLKEGRYWTLLTSSFSHMEPFHLLGNMVGFFCFAQILAHTPAFTPFRLVTLVLGSGIAGSVGYLAHCIQRRDVTGHALGASGSLMGVGTVAAFLRPRTKILIFAVVPMPLWALIVGYAVYDGFFLNDERSNVAHAGHIGGLTFGAAYYFARIRGLRI